MEKQKFTVTIGGKVELVYDVPEAAQAKARPPMSETPLSKLPSALVAPELGPRLEALLDRDGSELARKAFAPHDADFCRYLGQNKVPEACKAARKSSVDVNLKPEVSAARALESAGAALNGLHDAAQETFSGFTARYLGAKRIRTAALLPEGDPAILELRAQEIRSVLRSQDMSARVQTVVQAASRGGLEAIAAVSNDPLGAGLVDERALDNARSLALDACGLGWADSQLQDEAELLGAFAQRLDNIEVTLTHLLGGPDFELRLARPSGVPFALQARVLLGLEAESKELEQAAPRPDPAAQAA